MKHHSISIVIPLLLLAAPVVFSSETAKLIRSANHYFSPLAASMPGSENDTPERITLGKKLFFEKRLSVNNKQACASCHRLENGFAGVDNKYR